MLKTATGRIASGLLACLVCSSAQAAFVATGVTGSVQNVGESAPLTSGQIIDGAELQIMDASGRLMAFFTNGEVEVTLIAVGPALFAVNGTELRVTRGKVRLIISGNLAEPFQLLLESDADEQIWYISAGDVRAVREGDGAGLSYMGSGSAEMDGGPTLSNGEAAWSADLSDDPQNISAKDFATRTVELDNLNDLRLSHARSTRDSRDVNLFDEVLQWDRVSKAQFVRQEIRRQEASRARTEIRQVATVTTNASPPRAVVPPVASTSINVARGANAVTIGQGDIMRGAGALSLTTGLNN